MKSMLKHYMNMNILMKYHLKKHPEKQIKKAIEELKELTKELEYHGTEEFVLENLLDELFDAWFMIEQMSELFINEDTKHLWYMIIEAKIDREIIRHGLEGQNPY